MAKQPHRFLDPANFWLYSFYVVLLSVTSGWLAEFLKGIFGLKSPRSMGWTSLACFVVTYAFWLLCRYEFRARLENAQLNIIQIKPKPPTPSRGLIALCALSPLDKRDKNAAFVAASYHRETLKHLWLVTSRDAEETAKWVNAQVAAWGTAEAHTPIVLDDTSAVNIIKLKVEDLRREAIEGYKIAEEDIICDFTGMPKPVTAGMILACAPKGRRLQYLQGKYDANGKLMPDAPATAIEIEIEYEVESEL